MYVLENLEKSYNLVIYNSILQVILIGYMGSGKTTVGQLLASYMKMKFYDLDHYISVQEQEHIRDIFLKKGENYFREVESFYLNYILKSIKNYVLSSGGGTPCHADNILLMKRLAKTVYLKLSPELIYQRLRTQKTNRPIISHLSDKELNNFIFKHFSERMIFYEQADYIVDIINKSPLEIAHYIQRYLLDTFV